MIIATCGLLYIHFHTDNFTPTEEIPNSFSTHEKDSVHPNRFERGAEISMFMTYGHARDRRLNFNISVLVYRKLF